jgi:hypothetical protein
MKPVEQSTDMHYQDDRAFSKQLHDEIASQTKILTYVGTFFEA